MSKSLVVEPSEVATASKRSLGLSVIATMSVVVIPTFIAFSLLVFSQPRPFVMAAVIASVLLTTGAAIAGAALWARQPESAGVSFGDLMLWSWVRHSHAERALEDATRTLGLDRSGRPRGNSTASDGERLEAMLVIANALDSKSSYTLGHSRRVERHARRMAERLELDAPAIENMALAASLHDVGNVGLSDAIIRKAGEPTQDERSAIEAHVLLGATIVEQTGAADVVEGIRHHHEHWNGDGYADRLSGLQIPLFARVISIAEAYDAMTSARPYRQGFGTRDAVAILRSEAGSQFDPDLVEMFVSTLRKPFSLIERAPFLANLQRHVRELWLVFRRIGAIALSAAASTIAISLILGSTVLTPGTAPDEAVQDVAKQEGSQPLDRVLGNNVVAADDEVAATEDSAFEDAADVPSATDDAADDPSVPDEGPALGTIGGDGIAFDPEDSSDGTGTDPDPDGGGTDPDPDGGGTDPEPGGGEQPPPPDDDPKDKNPDANGNGHANGHDKDKGKP